MNDLSYAIGLDVGGTSLKSALVSSDGSAYMNLHTSINSQGSKEDVIKTFIYALNRHLKTADDHGLRVCGIGIGMPGPFDYKRGVCLIPPHLHKFQALYGLNIREELAERTGLDNILFENDARTFLLGEEWMGLARGFRRIIGITLGTGMGSSFMVDGRIVSMGKGIPRSGWIGGMKCDWGIAEDRISQRWILHRYQELTNKSAENVEQIAKNCDAACIEVFEELGRTIGYVLLPIAQRFEADCIVFGGQISKSFQLFEKPLREKLRFSSVKLLGRAEHIDLSPMIGAAKLIFLRERLI
jgi:glucokinase